MDTPTNPWQPGTDPGVPSDTTPARTRRPLKGLALVAAGAIGATALTGVAFAATSTPSPSNPESGTSGPANPEQGGPDMMGGDRDGDGPGGPGGFGGPDGRRGHHGDGGPMGLFGGPGGPKGMGGRVLHGEAVVTKQDGSNVTVRVQNGDIAAVSATEITVKSSDGFEQTWPLTADTKIHRNRADAQATDLVVGDRVMVIGEVNGDTVTTLRVGALDAEQAKALDAEREQRQQQHDNDRQQSVPSPSTTS